MVKRDRDGAGDPAAGAETRKRRRGFSLGSVLKGAKERLVMPFVRTLVVPRLAKRALLDHDVCAGVPGVPIERAVHCDGLEVSVRARARTHMHSRPI